MKNIITDKICVWIFLAILAIFIVGINTVDAQTPTPKTKITPMTSPAGSLSPTAKLAPTTLLDNDVQILKDKIATKVAELQKKSKTVVTGTVTENNKNSITIVSNDSVTHKVTYDDTITKLFSVIKKTPQEIKITDIKKGDYLVVQGLQIEDSVTASVIIVDHKYQVLSGKVSNTDKDNFEVTVVTTDKETYTIDVESSTKQSMINPKTGTIVKSGFSKINVGDNIHFVIVKPADTNSNKSTATRLLLIPQEYFVKK